MTNRHVLTAICLVALLATPLERGVFALEEVATSTASTSEATAATIAATSETASTTTVLPTETAVKDTAWYTSERVFGNDIQIGDFVVGPGRTEIEVSPGETVIQEITVTNRISDGRLFKLEVEDIAGSKDGSSAVNLTGAARGPYSIHDYIELPREKFELELGERARIPITISVPPDAEPGGYYGSVLVSTIREPANDREASQATRSPIIARIGSLFFVTVRGDTVAEGKTTEITTVPKKWWYEAGPIDLGILYENTGSIHVNPYGELSVTNMFGEAVGYVELEPWFVLPDSLRIKELSWDREFLLGRYTVTAKINRGYDNIVDTVTTSFWVLPWKIVGGLFVVLFIILFSLRAFFRKFEFKRKE